MPSSHITVEIIAYQVIYCHEKLYNDNNLLNLKLLAFDSVKNSVSKLKHIQFKF